jgi:SAM-dependent methyltransferase
MVYERGRPFHHERSLARVRAVVGDAPVERALDVACGTGMSTVALGARARSVVGVDVSAEMLRAARPARGVSYLLARAEFLPVPDRAVDAVTCCSGVHWFDQPRFFAELARVLRPRGWVALYDHYFVGEMVDVPEFGAWAKELFDRFPLPDRNHQVGDPRAETPERFERLADDVFGDDIEMTHDSLVDYHLSISNCVAAVERGHSREDVQRYLAESTAPFFAGAPVRTVRFIGTLTCLRLVE